ncbi:Phage-related lysozyme (muraminidase) [Ewingella americana]|uniref:Phage-related lysozyme (Muraminidase) n=1 Tax=Ewingella americana TaxID=41202 RepID=A0A377N8F4_9GAMM|nr:Phage-related lysozyme (muraminidase) [Ewingella americana]
MKTELPVDGYASAHALMEAMQGTNGDTFWLAKAEGHWHGGIHLKDSISGTSGFRSMTDGHIVAYRLNDDYLRAPSGPKMLKFTSTFILIKSTCTPDADKPADALDFYTLWMQLSPLSKYGGDRPALVTASSLKVRQNSAESRWARGGIPAGHSVNASGENLSLYGVPVDSGGTLPRGTEVEILEEASFFLKRRASPFVFVRVISVPSGKNSSLAVGETGWVSGLGKYLKRQPSTIPGWMQKAKARGEFNQVVTLAGDDLIAVAAGEKIGHAGNNESPGVAPCAFSHLEIFSQDSRFPDFVENKAGLSVGEKLLRSEAGKTLWQYRERENRFVAMEGESARQTSDRQFTKLTDAKKTEADGRLWYFIEKENGWLPASDVTEIEHYDLAERGFVMLVQEEPPTDVTKGFQESWLREAYGKLEVHSAKQNGMYSLSLTEYYQKRLRKWDLDGDQKLSGYEIWRGLHCRESWCRDIVQRLLVKHHSEWLHDADSARWRPRLAELSKRYPTIAQYNHAHINALVWMKDVPEIRSGEALWHMHPLVFLDAITRKFSDTIDFQTSLGIYKISKKSADLILKAEGYQKISLCTSR